MKFKATYFLFFIMACYNMAAQSSHGKNFISGVVKDSATGKPLEFCSIGIFSEGRHMASRISDQNGWFQFDSLINTTYSLLISFTGYNTKDTMINLDSAGSNNVIIALYKNEKLLTGVIVTSTKPLIKREIDKLVYNTEADPETKFQSVHEMMRKVPFLSVDAQGNILLKGNSSYRILINGKPSGMMDNNAAEVLKNMPASTIQSIEVFTTPPAKYEAEGLGGIINIVTTKRVGEGYKGSINLNQSFPAGSRGAGFSFTATRKKFGIELFGGGHLANNPAVNSRVARSTFGEKPTQLNVSGTNQGKNNGRYIGSQLSYEIDSLQLITAQLNANGYYPDGQQTRNSVLFQQNALFQQFTQQNNSEGSNRGFDGSVNYQPGFKKDKSKLLTGSYRYMQYKSNSQTDIDFFDQINYPMENFNQFNNTLSIENTAQADYVQTLKKVKLEAGVKAIFIKNESDFRTLVYDAVTGLFEEDPGQQNIFTNHQSILSAYNTYMFAIKKWEIKAGLRLEQTLNNINFQSTNTKVKNSYFNLVPSMVLNRNMNNGMYANFGYNQRLKRPGINRLNPFINRSNPNFIEYGNLQLQPSLMHSFDLGYGFNKKHSLNIGVSYIFANNLDLKNSKYDTASKITYTTYANTGNIDALTLNYSLTLKITKELRTIINGNIAQFWIAADPATNTNRKQSTLYTASISNTYTFNKGWVASASVNIFGKNLAPAQVQGTINGYISTNFSLSKSFFSDKLSLSAYLNNPFNKYRTNRTEISSFDFIETNNSRDYFRKKGISLNYRFGKLKNDVKRNKRGINNNDVSN